MCVCLDAKHLLQLEFWQAQIISKYIFKKWFLQKKIYNKTFFISKFEEKNCTFKRFVKIVGFSNLLK